MTATSAANYPTLGFDPAPGDHTQAADVAGTARSGTDVLAEIGSVLHGAADGEWRGQAAIAFRDLLDDDVRPKVDKAAGVLRDWADQMWRDRAEARRLERLAAEAAERLSAAQSAVAGLPAASTSKQRLSRLTSRRSASGSGTPAPVRPPRDLFPMPRATWATSVTRRAGSRRSPPGSFPRAQHQLPRIVDGYLVRIAVAARDLPAEQVEELLTEIREHIDAALASSGDNDATAVQEVIQRLGTPEEIAVATGAAVPTPPVASPKRGAALGSQEIAAVPLLLFGGFIFGVGWIVGVVLLWTSERWSTADKLLGTFVWPFGIAAPLAFPVSLPGAPFASGGLWLLTLVPPIIVAVLLLRALKARPSSTAAITVAA